MNYYLIFRYLHLLFLFIMIGSVITQQFLLKKQMNGKEIRVISRTDLVYGISSIVVVGLGLTLWFGVGKPADFYSKNHLFLIKVGLFILVGLLSVYPTLFYRNKRKALKENESTKVPGMVRWVVRLELIILLFIPLLAVLMAAGTGLS
ncbi:DUF2214 family protein [Robertkochia marina]|uniref:DUF2214 family protein n=1 Tax=Robertkochia marina TaxID=1227945 RepID=A0A4S3LXE8_9FLAO|nr:DUF2214 family protein [Robertkochia marina]THD65742.1 DUF2214 family protein [Robertkochia marina]TRZ46573.1 DUF2214 family protein [Robertkochia marina]